MYTRSRVYTLTRLLGLCAHTMTTFVGLRKLWLEIVSYYSENCKNFATSCNLYL